MLFRSEGFGEEWATYDQRRRDPRELRQTFDRMFGLFPWDALPSEARGIDVGCGSGRWARLAAARVDTLYAIDPALRALGAARDLLAESPNVHLVAGAAGSLPLPDASMDFGYSLGVLHHTPDPAGSLRDCVRCMRPGAPLLVYLYYALDNRPGWFRALWRLSDSVRRTVSTCPPRVRHAFAAITAVTVYWPLARLSRLLGKRGRNVPLAGYAAKPLHVMRTDAYDRFATRLEHRFTRSEVVSLLEGAGLERVAVQDTEPFWCAIGFAPG